MRIGNGAKLAEAAKSLINTPSVFRERFGDYYVHEISHEARFTAVWKCTSQSESTLVKFKSSIDVDVDAQGSGNFESQLKSAAKESNALPTISLYSTPTAFPSRAPCTSVITAISSPRSQDPLRWIPDLYVRTRRAFDDIRLAVLLNSTLPADESSRIRRRRKIEELFREIHSKRSNYSVDPQVLSDVLNDLAGLLEEFNQILACHELITSLRSLSFEDVIREHPIDYTDVHCGLGPQSKIT
ncbi:hypothetical protein EDB83DRAFT_2676188 [Lactarius deliciosus]|nr:hypothetical protein EDB83DRAFT_2676188 [Lactarius deliciosus]